MTFYCGDDEHLDGIVDDDEESNIISSKTNGNWTDSMGYPENERDVQIMGTENERQEENIKLGPMDDGWMEAIGCMSDIEEEQYSEEYSKTNSAAEKTIAVIDETLVTPLALGIIENTWMESMGNMIDSDEKEKPNVKNDDSHQGDFNDFDNTNIENYEEKPFEQLNENCN